MSIILFEGGQFCLIILEDFKEIFHQSQKKYVVRKGGGGKKQS